jgi:undecaprenyl-diphosphatase
MNPFDVTVFHWINHLAGHLPVVDALLSFIARYALELYAALFLVGWFALPKTESRQRHNLVVAGFAGILALAVNALIGAVWFRPRPFMALPKGTMIQLIPHSADASFPSDHVSGAFAFSGALWRRGPRWLSRTFTVLAVILLFARVYVGVHWPTDVLASVVVGVASSSIMWRFEKLLVPVTRLGLKIFRYGEFASVANTG